MHAQYKHSGAGGGALLNLLVVVVIVTLLAALIVPALQKASTASPNRACMAKVRGIPAMIRAYSVSWGGWTHPDPDYYIKLGGLKLSYEEGWAPGAQLGSKDFVCPFDQSPGIVHGVKTSYFVESGFAGVNIMELKQPANRILVARESVFRHSLPGDRDKRLGAHFSFADGSAALLSLEELQEHRKQAALDSEASLNRVQTLHSTTQEQ